MPTYEYVCRDCGTHIEVYQRFSDEPMTVCGVCGGQLRKVFHPAGILFKGPGFYATDSRRSASTKAGASEKTDSPGSSEKKDTAAASSTKPAGSDTKPAGSDTKPSTTKEKSA